MPYRVIPGGASSSRCYLVDGGGNGDYQTIQAAINAAHANTPTATNRWLVLVGPGTYTESLTLYNYVDVSGLSPGPAAIVVAPTGQYVIATPANCWVSNVKLSGQTDPIIMINTITAFVLDSVVMDEYLESTTGIKISADAVVELRGCNIKVGGHGVNITGLGAYLDIINSKIEHFNVSGVPTEYPLRVEGGYTTVENSVLDNLIAGAGVYFASNPSQAKIINSIIRQSGGGDSVDCAGATANAVVAGCLTNGAIDVNVGVATGNTTHASI